MFKYMWSQEIGVRHALLYEAWSSNSRSSARELFTPALLEGSIPIVDSVIFEPSGIEYVLTQAASLGS